MQLVNGIKVLSSDPSVLYQGLDKEPTWFSAQGGVYQCYDLTTQQPVAIKKYLVENTQQSDVFVMPQELVENEIYTMTKCNHHNIVKLLSVHLHQEFVYLIMPLCAGGSLQQHVFHHHLNFGQLAFIIASIAAGLQEIHRHGYIHRDIKCDNIFLDDQTNQIVIGDFGVVSITASADSSVEEAGVVLFWAPELVQGKIINSKVDIWALGIVILEIINGGRAPYEDDKLDEDEIKRRILIDGNPAYPIGLPPRLYDLLDKCLNPDPRARASASDILKHPFVLESKHQSLFETSVGNPSSVTCIDPAVANKTTMFEDPNMPKELEPTLEMDVTCGSTASVHGTPNSLESTQRQEIPANDAATLTVSPSSIPPTNRVRKCRLPIPSFTLKDLALTPIHSKDKIANVQFNRRSLNKTYRKQGCRLPMVILPQSISSSKKVKKSRSTRLSSSTPSLPTCDHSKSNVIKKEIQANRIQVQQKRRQRNNTNKKLYQESSLPAPLKSTMSAESSVTPATRPLSYRQKRLSETRTGLLMMGISTTVAARGKSSSMVSPAVTPGTIPISATRLSSTLTAPLGKQHQEAQHSRPFHPTTSLSTVIAAPYHDQKNPSTLPHSSQRHHQQQQRQRDNGNRSQRLSSSTRSAKMRNRLPSLDTKKEPPSPLTTANGSIGKNDSFKEIKVLQAY